MKRVQWPPVIPPRLRKSLASFGFYKDGVIRSYKGRPRHVCGKRVSLDQIPSLWSDLCRKIDAQEQGIFISADGLIYAQVAALFYKFLDHRVEKGKPKPLAEATRIDYERTITEFGRLKLKSGQRVAERPIRQIGEEELTAFALAIANKAPSTLARHHAYISNFFVFCKRGGYIENIPEFGNYFARPVLQQHRDVRLKQRKSFTPHQIRMQYFHATLEEKIWLLLGLFAAFDNSDLANLTHETIDREVGTIDFRRRKTGLMPRLIPVPDEFWPIFDLYRRPEPADPAHADRVFLTPEGFPLARVMRSKNGKPHRPDYVAMCWSRLMRRAGLREAASNIRVCKVCGLERVAPRTPCACGASGWKRREISKGSGGDRKGFRSLRTTFSNLAPPKSRDEVELIMGHSSGVLLENYLEEYGLAGLREVVNHIWHRGLNPETSPAPRPANPKG